MPLSIDVQNAKCRVDQLRHHQEETHDEEDMEFSSHIVVVFVWGEWVCDIDTSTVFRCVAISLIWRSKCIVSEYASSHDSNQHCAGETSATDLYRFESCA